jgi:hypothetical protein
MGFAPNRARFEEADGAHCQRITEIGEDDEQYRKVENYRH